VYGLEDGSESEEEEEDSSDSSCGLCVVDMDDGSDIGLRFHFFFAI
jgi:hypothetical protein